VGQLARYWAVSRKQIYKQIEGGTLTAVRFGPRLLRIKTSEALRFEREAKMTPEPQTRTARVAAPPPKAAKMHAAAASAARSSAKRGPLRRDP
jgi:excisionase family DNA binding protein